MKDSRILHKTNDVLYAELIADIFGVTKATVQKWENQGVLVCQYKDKLGKKYTGSQCPVLLCSSKTN